jgi:hypothetical protein
MRYTAGSPRNECAPTRAISCTAITLRGPPNSTSTAAPTSIHFPSRLFSDVWFQIAKVESFRGPFVSRLGAICESAYDLTPKRLPTVTLVGRPINSSIQCVAVRGLGSDLDADRASDPTPNNNPSCGRSHESKKRARFEHGRWRQRMRDIGSWRCQKISLRP